MWQLIVPTPTQMVFTLWNKGTAMQYKCGKLFFPIVKHIAVPSTKFRAPLINILQKILHYYFHLFESIGTIRYHLTQEALTRLWRLGLKWYWSELQAKFFSRLTVCSLPTVYLSDTDIRTDKDISSMEHHRWVNYVQQLSYFVSDDSILAFNGLHFYLN